VTAVRVEVPGTPAGAENFRLPDGRVFRVLLRLLTPPEKLATAAEVEVETEAVEVTASGEFVVEAGAPVVLPRRRAIVPLERVRAGLDTMRPGWRRLPLAGAALAAELDRLPNSIDEPELAEPGDRIRKGGAVFEYGLGVYADIREGRLREVPAAALSDTSSDAPSVDSLRP
jgi:hypothetical protein